MQPSKKQRIIILIAFLSTVILLMLLLGFQSLWVVRGTAANLMRQVGLQPAREQRIVANVLILAYRPTSEHAQALSALQNLLPLWQKTQNGLMNGDDSLGLPKRSPQDIQLLLLQAQPDYVAISTATQKILDHPDRLADQLPIIMDHQNDYYVTMTQIVSLWQSHIDAVFYQLFWWEAGLDGACLLIVVCIYLFIVRRLLRGKPPPPPGVMIVDSDQNALI